jgi:hypothetical protein
VKSASLKASLVFGGARRLEAENFLASGYGTRVALETKCAGWSRLFEFARVWQPPRLKGTVVAPEYGKPYLSATQVFDVRPASRRFLSVERIADPRALEVREGQILITRSGTVGRSILAHCVHQNHVISDDLLRVDAKDQSWWGWIYAYLRAPTVRSMMKAAQYGHIIKHLETHHLEALPIVRLRRELRASFELSAKAITAARNRAQRLEVEAEAEYQRSVSAPADQDGGADVFSVRASAMFGRGRRLEGNYYNLKARAAEETIRKGAKRLETVADLAGRVFVPGRFKHVYGDEGVPYLDSAQILEAAPDIDKRVLSLRGEKQAGYLVDSGVLLIPCSGQLHGIIGSVVLATQWHESKVLTNHILRVVPKRKAAIRIGYLQMVLGHPLLGRPRVLKGAFGSSVPELGPDDISSLSVPRLDVQDEEFIADAMEEAAELRAHANEIEEKIANEAEEFVNRFLAGDRSHVECVPDLNG